MISTNLAIFGFFPSKKHDSVWYYEFLIETFIQKSQNIENNDNKYLFSIFFAYFSKTIDFGSVFSAEMNFACKKHTNKRSFIGFENNSHLSLNFC